MKNTIGTEYIKFLDEIKSRIVTARIQAIRSVNKELINLYWYIGRAIVERQKEYKWGNAVVERLALDLSAEFNSVAGFSVQNLWRMRLLYLEYKDSLKLAQLVREIPWGQNIVIMQMVKNVKEREYYIRATAMGGGTMQELLLISTCIRYAQGYSL